MPRITRNGRVTIPAEIRRKLDLREGDEISFEVVGDRVILRKKECPTKAIRNWLGSLDNGGGRRADAIMNELRGEADHCGG